jgi:hypothetical protein
MTTACLLLATILSWGGLGSHAPACFGVSQGPTVPAWVMRDEAGLVVDSYDVEADCRAAIPGARADWTCTLERILDISASGTLYTWRLDGTRCGPYPVDPTQTVCKEQTVSEARYLSEEECRADIPDKQREGYTDLSCARIEHKEPCGDIACGP